MEPERLKRIDFLFNQAISLPPGERELFLAKECRDNEKDIYDDVLSLLPYQTTDNKFLESSPFPVNARFKTGDFIGQYEIHSFIGHGSTGDVYSARHPRLPGRVAIKVLAKHLVNDAAFLERFKSEAHITDSLAHPHILKVLDIGQQGDVHYIVSEFVDGSSLREYIGKLPLAQAMDYACQIGEALETAHDAGIIHRDIKPENIMVLKGARHIKVLDFGLAKQTRLPPKQDSLSGVVIGTLGYMSPEALQGNVDSRADIWSWSVVLYEMVAGKLPSEAGDARNRPSNNRDLNRWMARALAPRIEERHQTIQEALQDLPKIVQVSPWRKWRRLAAALVLLLAAVSAYWLWINRPQVIFRVAPLTDSGNITLAAISPDAKYVAYAATASGGQLLNIRQIDSPQERMVVPVNPEEYIGITFSPDGQYIYYVREQKDGSKILYRVSVQGGDSKLVLKEVDTGISFSPDGKQIAFLRGHQPPPPDTYIKVSVVLATVDGTSVGVPRELPPLASPDVFLLNAPLWSTDGLSVLCVKWDTTKKDAQIMTIRVTDGQVLRQMPVPWKWMGKPVWLKDGRSLAVYADTQLLEMSWPDGRIWPWGHEFATYGDLDAAPGSRQIVSVQYEKQTSLWIVPLTATDKPWKVEVPAKFNDLTWTPSGTLVSRTKIGGAPDLWSINPNTLEKHAITEDNFTESDPVVSRDGKYLVYASDREGTSNLWRSNLDGSNPIRLTYGSSVDKQPTITPDNNWVVYTSVASGMETLWIISINGGQPVQLTYRPSRNPVISPNGRKILCEYAASLEQAWSTVALNRDTGQLEDTYPGIPEDAHAHWSADGAEIFYVVSNNQVSEIWAQPANKKIHGGKPRLLTHFTEDAIYALAPSPDGRSLACIRGNQSANAVLIETARWPRTYF